MRSAIGHDRGNHLVGTRQVAVGVHDHMPALRSQVAADRTAKIAAAAGNECASCR